MTIFRVNHDRKNPFVMVNKGFLENPGLSLKAKGILAYLLSKPDKWQARISDIEKHCKDGCESIRSGIQELEAAGYFRRIKDRDESGRFTNHITEVYEAPELQSSPDELYKKIRKGKAAQKSVSPELENPVLDNPELDEPTSENTPLSRINPETNYSAIQDLGDIVCNKPHNHPPLRENSNVDLTSQELQNSHKDRTYKPSSSKDSEKAPTKKPNSIFETNLSAAEMLSNFDNHSDCIPVLEEKARLGEEMSRLELLALAEHYGILELVPLYRHSGEFFHTNLWDIKDEFVQFVLNYSFKNNPDTGYVINTIKMYERQPDSWSSLMVWLEAWQEEIQKSQEFYQRM